METFYKGNKYEGVIVETYKGTLSLCAAQRGSDGKIYKKWAHPTTYEDGQRGISEKAWPVKCVLGTKENAIGILKAIILDLEGSGTQMPSEEFAF